MNDSKKVLKKKDLQHFLKEERSRFVVVILHHMFIRKFKLSNNETSLIKIVKYCVKKYVDFPRKAKLRFCGKLRFAINSEIASQFGTAMKIVIILLVTLTLQIMDAGCISSAIRPFEQKHKDLTSILEAFKNLENESRDANEKKQSHDAEGDNMESSDLLHNDLDTILAVEGSLNFIPRNIKPQDTLNVIPRNIQPQGLKSMPSSASAVVFAQLWSILFIVALISRWLMDYQDSELNFELLS